MMAQFDELAVNETVQVASPRTTSQAFLASWALCAL